MTRCLLICVAVVWCLAFGDAAPRVRRWVDPSREWVAAPGQGPLQLHDVLAANSNLKYSDYTKKLTVIKDVSSDIRACFITDLDPEWTLSYADKMELMDSVEREDIRSPNDLLQLQEKAGPDIASMCMKMHIYWLNSSPMPIPKMPSGASGPQAPPLLNQAPPSFNQAPPSLMKTPPPLNQAPPSFLKTPPPLVKTPSPEFKVPLQQGVVQEEGKAPEFQAPMRTPPPLFPTPPPLHAAKVAYKDVVAAPQAIRTPPPLEEYLARRTSSPTMRVPPPLELYRRMQSQSSFRVPPPL